VCTRHCPCRAQKHRSGLLVPLPARRKDRSEDRLAMDGNDMILVDNDMIMALI
jgi:hypothetical protein